MDALPFKSSNLFHPEPTQSSSTDTTALDKIENIYSLLHIGPRMPVETYRPCQTLLLMHAKFADTSLALLATRGCS